MNGRTTKKTARMKGQTPKDKGGVKVPVPKVVGVLVVLAIMLVGVLGVNALQKSQGRGELAFDIENVDVGKVPLGQTVTQHFVMRNVGDGPVTITKSSDVVLEGC